MSILLEKSENSISAAELLHQECYYASSIHCSYYSCVQFMKYMGINCFKDFVDDDDFDEKQAESKTGSHAFLINFITKKISGIGADFRDFRKYIFLLKETRENADYKEIEINEHISEWAIGKSIEVKKNLKTSFKI